MSTVMRVWRIRKSDLWNTLDMIRGHYESHHPVPLEIAVLASVISPSTSPEMAQQLRRDALRLARTGETGQEDWHPEIQIFSEGESCLLRPLEIGTWFGRQVDDQEWPFEEIHYDNRTDVPAEEEGNKAVAEWLDTQISAGRYVTHMLLDPTRLHLMAIRLFPGD